MQLEIRLNLNLRAIKVLVCLVILALLVPALPSSKTLAAPYGTELIGNSLQGRPVLSYRFGQGSTHIAFIGGIHQGNESNSTDLINKAVTYYSDNPNEIPAGLTVYFIPNVNPDGFDLKQRTNSRGVDLNRNWPTQDWKPDTFDVDGLVKGGGGSKPFSEAETENLWNYIQANEIISAIFYHARGGDVVDTNPTAAGLRYGTTLARTLSFSTGYTYLENWSFYDISGDSTDFLNSRGIYSLTVELNSYTDPDWSQNLRGFSTTISFFNPRFINETGHSLSGKILAYWNSNGGVNVIGNPTGEPQELGTKLWQQFQRGSITIDLKTGLAAFKEKGTGPVEVPTTPSPLIISKNEVNLRLPGIPVPAKKEVEGVDSQSNQLRDRINQLQQNSHDLEQQFFLLAQKARQLPVGPVLPAVSAPTLKDPNLEKQIKVLLNPNAVATVFAYEKNKLVKTMGAFSGKIGSETPAGEFKINLKIPILKTTRWYEDDGTEYYLNKYISFTNDSLASTGTPDDWGFHQMRIPLDGPNAGQMQAGPSHGCLALTPSDAEWLFNWASPGTPVLIN